MHKTPQEFKRENIKKLFNKILKQDVTLFTPLDISVAEREDEKLSDVKFSFLLNTKSQEFVELNCQAQGFVDGLFTACYNNFSDQYKSLKNIKLFDYQVKPNLKKTKNNLGTDAKVEVAVMTSVQNHGIAEFSSYSRSVLRSSFIAVLETFQFYINCERSFHKIQTFIADAQKRNRGDIISGCMFDLATLTEVNNYARKPKS